MGNPNMRRQFVPKYEKICVDCGKSFLAVVSNGKRCKDCAELQRHNRFKTHLSKPIKRTPKECERCHQVFTPASNNVRYCDECKAEMKRLNNLRKPIKKCPCCGGYFIKTGNNQKRCPLCGFKQLYAGDYRTIAFENLPHRCGHCGVEVDLFTADVHHKDRNRNNNSLENLEILCKSCHHMEHIIRDELTGKIIGVK